MANNLSGQFNPSLISAGEGGGFGSGTTVASFTDGNTSDTAANFTVTIDWGDGTTDVGTVTGSNGTFTVTNTVSHLYADEGFPTPVVTVTRTTDSAQLVMQSPGISVADNDKLTGQGQPTIVASPNQTLTNVTVATFKNNNGVGFQNVATDFTVNIDWGDGTTTPGTLAENGNTYTVTGSHSYTAAGNFTITTFMTDDGGDNAFSSATTQADIGFGGTVVLSAADEFVAVPSGTEIATFADNGGFPATDYTALIDWGDGTTTGGTVTGSNGMFTVSSTVAHTYNDEGLPTAVVTITNTANSTTIAPSGTVSVFENDSLTAFAGPTVSASPGVSTGSVTVATFTASQIFPFNPSSPNVAGDFVATVDWGDGSTDMGTVTGSSGSFTVTDSHTYTQNGQDIITVTLGEDASDGQSTANAIAQTKALVGLAPVAGSTINATEGTAIAAGTQVATFSDSSNTDAAGSFTAKIDWGDGTTDFGTVTGSPGSFTVSSTVGHTYGDEGPETVTTTLTRTADNVSATATGSANVAEADSLALTTNNISGNAGQAFTNVQLATFTDTFTGNVAGDFTAIIDWGDSTTTTGAVSGSGGTFTVDGSHTYTNGGTDTIKISVADDSFGTATASGTATATINLGGHMVLTSATEGTPLANNTAVATFSDSNGGDTSLSFTATISWGDGTSSTGTVVGGPSPGTFTVEGGHTYTDEGNDTAVVTLTHTSDNSTATVSGNVAVAEADALTGHAANFSTTAGSTFNGAVATFTDTFTGNVAGDFATTIDWGDGNTTTGTVVGSGGSFTVDGSHSYDTYGLYSVKVQGADDDAGTATFSATDSATVSLAGTLVLTSATEATPLPNSTVVATFTGGNPNQGTGTFTATIDWGDGVTTPGSVSGSGGTFTVEGGHTYADEFSAPAKVTLADSATGIQSTASGTVAVAEADVLAGTGTKLKLKSQVPFTGVVATFTDTDTANVAGDFNATINWGDGTTTSGVVTGGSGSFTVSGTHTYTHPGHENITVKLTDDAPGTATATANSTANVSAIPKNDFEGDFKSDFLFQNRSSNHPNVMVELLNGSTIASSATITAPSGLAVEAAADFNNDNKEDIVLQASDGTPQIWLMNGTSVTSTVTLPTPGSSWHIIAAADFNNDGTSDLLFQNNDGTVGIWEMNGTSVVSMTMVGNPGTAWRAIGAGDFNNDGNADILFQNVDNNQGTPLIWEMNGASIIAQATLPNPGSAWRAVGTGDFNGDGSADILFQNKDGTPGVWLMNGTSVTSMNMLTNPGSQWVAIGTGDFNGDGNADILFQNTNGTPGVWEMNGATVLSMTMFPNPGSQWQAKDDGPIQTDAGAGQPALHSSSPDTASGIGASTEVSLTNLVQPQVLFGAGLHLT